MACFTMILVEHMRLVMVDSERCSVCRANLNPNIASVHGLVI